MIENNKSKIVKGQGKPNFSLWFFSVRNGARVRFLRDVLGRWLAWAQDLCMLPQSLWVHICFDHVNLEDLVFMISPIFSGSCTLYASSYTGFHEPSVEGFF